MYGRFLLLLTAILFSICANAQSVQPQPFVYNKKIQSSLLFMENRGQVVDIKDNPQPDILFSANSGGAKIYLSANAIHYQFTRIEYPKGYDPTSKEPLKDFGEEEALRRQIKTSTHRFTVELQGANPNPTVNKQQQSSYFENYYLAQCPNGITGVHGYEKIIYKNVYPRIDWVIYSKGGFMEYDFLVHPGGNPADIKLKIKDAENVGITAAGELLMKTSLGEVKEKAPVSYADGHIVLSRFKQNGDGTIGFEVQAQPGKELRIDPSIVWSTYYGGTGGEGNCYGAVDNSNNVYLAGLTMSPTNIASGGFQNNHGGGQFDAFLVKFDAGGNPLWATYYGGNANEGGYAVTTDVSGNVFLAGKTNSTNGIFSNGFQAAFGGYDDAYLIKFNSSGSRLWGTYYGGSGADYARSCSTDANGNVYMSGGTASSNNIASGGFQNTLAGFNDAFLVKFSSTGSRLWGTYYGGAGTEDSWSCCTDNAGFIYLAGYTNSDGGIAYQGFRNTKEGLSDNFLVKLAGDGTRVWATYYGGENNESDGVCCTDPSGNIYLAGSTQSSTDIFYNGYYSGYGGATDFYLVKFSGNCSRQWSTYVGGPGGEMNPFLSCNAAGDVYIAGTTTSGTRIYLNGLPNYNLQTAYYDAFLMKFGTAGNCAWGTYYGGSNLDIGSSCTADNAGNVYLSGQTGTSGLGVNGFQNNFTGNPYTSFLVKIGAEPLCIASTLPNVSAISDTICSGSSTTINITSGNLNSATTWQWHKDSCNGITINTGPSITVSPTATTTYYVRGEGGCATPGSCASKTITVNPLITPTVVLTANPSGPITAGTPVTFTATPTNFGTSPSFAFKVNGTTVQNGSISFYTTNTLNNGDVVTVTLNSNALCTSTPNASSNAITMVVVAPCIAPAIPILQATADTICAGTAATISVTSGSLNSATQWAWRKDSCNGPLAGMGTTLSVTPAATTTYYVRGEGGCVTPGACAGKTITVNTPPVASFTASPSSICSGDTISVTFTGTATAMANYLWNWGGGNVVSGSNAGPYKVVYSASSTIMLSVASSGCSVAANAQTITVTQSPKAIFAISDSVGCNTLAVSFTNTSQSVTGWQWNFGDGTSSNVAAPPVHQYITGIYYASLTVTNGQCSNTSVPKIIQVVNGPVALFSTTPGITTPISLSQAYFRFTNTSQNATRYIWRFTNADSSAIQNPSYQFKAVGSYTVTLIAYNSLGCADTFELKPIIVVADSALQIPNAFSPNNDGINDTWVIKGLQGATNYTIHIFNRWGQRIYSSKGYSKAWDGNYNGKLLPVDTYYYVITVGARSYMGSVMLLR